MDDDCVYLPSDTDLDLSFTTDRIFTSSSSSSARSSLARSSLTLSFNDRLSAIATPPPPATSPPPSLTAHPHRHADPHWTAINNAKTLSSDGTLHLRHLKLVRHLGTGNLGRVYLCRLRSDQDSYFALKVVDREHLTSKKLSHVEMEAEILSMLDHPFLPTLYANITASHYTCLLIDYCPAGDLHSLLRKQPSNRFSIHAVRFFAAEVLVALEYLHALGIVYRDLKPENILLRQDGHVMLSDFDLCFKADVVPTFTTTRRDGTPRKKNPGRRRRRRRCGGVMEKAAEEEADQMVAEFVAEPTAAYSRCCVGTHEYLAPELLSSSGHGNGVDWWAFGVLIYELLYGTTPFKGDTKESTLRNIASNSPVRFHVAAGEEEEEDEQEAMDLIEKLLVKEPSRRLGCTRGATDVKRHPFFAGIKWPLIRCYRPPPEVRGLVRKSKSNKSHVIAPAAAANHHHQHHHHIRRRWWWRGLQFFLRAKWSKRSNYYSKNSDQSNGNYYRYYVNNRYRKLDN